MRRAVRMPEGPSVDATELPLGQRMGGGRGEGSRASRRSAGGKVGAEEGAGQATFAAIGGTMVLGTTGGAEPLGGGEKGRRVVNRGRVVLVGGRLRGAGGVGERKLLFRGRVGRTLLGCRWEVVWRLLSDGGERARGASESAALGGGRKGGGELGSVGKLMRWLGQRDGMEEVVGVYVVHGIREDAHWFPSVVGGGIAKPVHEVLVAAKFVRREARDEAAVSDAVDDVLTVR